MYSTCLFCQSDLGANEAVEHFPIGRRLAFDAAKGRLWVVCRKCERWNLTPLEERWEAIEECERHFRATRLRVSTDQIGLARLAEGLELIRIGKPMRPEFAAWRYGDQFGRRRRKNMIRIGAVAVGVGTIPFLGPVFGVTLGASGVYALQLANFAAATYRGTHVVARGRDNAGNVLSIRATEVHETVMLEPTWNEPWGLRVTHQAHRNPAVRWWKFAQHQDQTEVSGEAAIRLAAQLLPRVNRAGASSRQIQTAVSLATEDENPTAIFERAARIAATKRSWNKFGKGALLSKVPTELRLALEMVSHEDSERRALEGELAVLEQAWKEAEEIAAISDDMFLPEAVSKRLAELKRR